MKKIGGLLLCGSLLLNYFDTLAQSYAESALLYSRTMPAGSSRIQSLGGSQVSLGGDYSSAMSNPAGLGMFNKSEFTFSLGVNSGSTNSTLFANDGVTPYGGLTNASFSKLQIPGLSLVFHKKPYNFSDDEDNAFKGGSFGITFSRSNDFNKSFSYKGTNPTSSLVDYFSQTSAASGDVSQFNPPDPNTGAGGGYNYGYPNFLAYDSYLIDSTTNTKKHGLPYYSVLSTDPNDPSDTRKVDQREDVILSGNQSQINVAYGANFFDKLFIGGGLGIATITYNSSKTFYESNYVFAKNPNNFNPVNEVVLSENLKSSGTGVNLNIGVIGRPVDFLQLGFSYNSPTLYSLHDTYSAALTTDYNNFDVAYYGYNSQVLNGVGTDQGVPILTQAYSLKTPSHINFGATVFVLKQGFITADVERVNYPGAKYSTGSSGIDFSTDNSTLRSTVQSTMNYRAGAEYRFKEFRVRAGYSFMPTPYVSTQYSYGVKQDITSLTAGLGYRTSKFFIDLAVVARQTNSGYTPYSTYSIYTGNDNSPKVTSSVKSTLVMVTVGFPFNR